MSFTDGLPDLRNEDGVYFDDEMIERFVLKHGKKSAKEFNTQLMQEIDDFRGELNYVDDIAVLTCKIK